MMSKACVARFHLISLLVIKCASHTLLYNFPHLIVVAHYHDVFKIVIRVIPA